MLVKVIASTTVTRFDLTLGYKSEIQSVSHNLLTDLRVSKMRVFALTKSTVYRPTKWQVRIWLRAEIMREKNTLSNSRQSN